MAPVAPAKRIASGVRSQDAAAAATSARRMSGSSSSLTRQTSPGTGKRAQISRTARETASSASGIVPLAQRAREQLADLAHLEAAEAARRRRGRAHADAGRRVGGQRVEGDGVLVDGDADLVEEPLGLHAGDAERASRRRG